MSTSPSVGHSVDLLLPTVNLLSHGLRTYHFHLVKALHDTAGTLTPSLIDSSSAPPPVPQLVESSTLRSYDLRGGPRGAYNPSEPYCHSEPSEPSLTLPLRLSSRPRSQDLYSHPPVLRPCTVSVRTSYPRLDVKSRSLFVQRVFSPPQPDHHRHFWVLVSV